MVPMSPARQAESHHARRFGLRVENRVLQVAIATRNSDGSHEIRIDEVHCQSAGGWLNVTAVDQLREALQELVKRHDMAGRPVAVSLDGDFCVSRITTGTSTTVDDELETLGHRIPRYLQLGPGEKVTGSCRQSLEANVDYAVTGVANRIVVSLLYESFRSCELEVLWLEPSLISLARLVGLAGLGRGAPVLIADGTGNQWDVGIAHEGRLLLDYRPAAASTREGFRAALDGHITRLQRFCQRHRRLASGNLRQLFVCGGSMSKAHEVTEMFSESSDIEASVLDVREIEAVFHVRDVADNQGSAPAVAAVLPLLVDLQPGAVPDLLEQVRRAPDLSPAARMIRTFWPAVAAVILLATSFVAVTQKRRAAASIGETRAAMENRMRLTQIRMTQLSGKRELVDHLQLIERSTGHPNWDTLFQRVTQSLPDRAKLNTFRVESDEDVVLDGTVGDESLVYDLVGHLRKLPHIDQVALKATNPESDNVGVRFLIGLTVRPTAGIGANRTQDQFPTMRP